NECTFTRVVKQNVLQPSQLQKLPLRIVTAIPDPIFPSNNLNTEQFPDLHLSDQFQALREMFVKSNRAVLLQRVFPPTVEQMSTLLMSKSKMASVLHFMGHCGTQTGDTRALIF